MENNLEKRIEAIEERNRRVESDKAWETSKLRIFALGIITFIFTTLFFYINHVLNPLQNAVAASIGFVLSTQSLSFIKKLWSKNK